MSKKQNERELSDIFGAYLMLGVEIWLNHRASIDKSNKQKPQSDTKSKKPVNPISPIKTQDIPRVKDFLLNKPQRYVGTNLRNFAMFIFNINVGLWSQDLLNLKVSDIWQNGQIVDVLYIKERNKKFQNKPIREIPLRSEIKELLNIYLRSLPETNENQYLFYPRGNPYKPMSRHNVNKLMNEIKNELDLQGTFGALSMKKTFSREKVVQIFGDEDLQEIIRHLSVGFEETPALYTKGSVV